MLAGLVGTAGRLTLVILRAHCPRTTASATIECTRCAHRIDRSKVPVLKEEDVVEQFVHGSGPGGQAVNKLSNCVMLCHTPTGIVVRCHESRLLHENRKMARKMLLEKLDDHLNGDMSVSAQKLRIKMDKRRKLDRKNEKLRELKRQYLERLKHSEDSDTEQL
ncbi:mitochondrial translation release factor in rescue [Dermacentor albipictus]|uniref:mitochondrial translation release factor in rescue n=1 Tax=Dermacentor albipictus TaxID=60249 RepID=UPI0038FC7562